MMFHSVFSKLLDDYLEGKGKTCTGSYVRKISCVLASFDIYCAGLHHMSEELTEELIHAWLFQNTYRSSAYQKQCRLAIRQFAIHLVENGKKAYVPPVCDHGTQSVEKAFESCLGESINGLVESKRARGYKYGALNEYGILKRIDTFCIEEGIEKEELPRWLVEKWSERTSNEGMKSRANRMVVIRQLALYMVSQGKEAYVAESAPFPHNPFPCIPNEKEMAALLSEIDSKKSSNPWSNYTLPVLFRMLLASGLRISEACSLKTGCIDFSFDSHCTVNINNAKGHKDRMIYLAGDVLTLLKKYNAKMSFMFPDREWFFPSDYMPQKKHLLASTARKHFNLAREKVFSGSTHKPTIHCLRHAFIIWTLRRWRKEHLDIEKMLPYLSKHIGHSSIQETFTYYNHYDQDYGHIKKDSEYFERMIPEVRYDA